VSLVLVLSFLPRRGIFFGDLTIIGFWFLVLTMPKEPNETAHTLHDAIRPVLDEFLDGYVLTGMTAEGAKKIILVKLGSTDTHYELLPILGAAEHWGGVEL